MLKGEMIMKTLKYIMTVITVVALAEVAHAQYASNPTYNFQSTSTMVGSGSSLPSAATAGVMTTYDEDYSSSRGNIRKVGPRPGDPGSVPVGSGVGVLLLLAIGYGIRVRRQG